MSALDDVGYCGCRVNSPSNTSGEATVGDDPLGQDAQYNGAQSEEDELGVHSECVVVGGGVGGCESGL
jgi:hypothetical protein